MTIACQAFEFDSVYEIINSIGWNSRGSAGNDNAVATVRCLNIEMDF
jgi:hypothetical protein